MWYPAISRHVILGGHARACCALIRSVWTSAQSARQAKRQQRRHRMLTPRTPVKSGSTRSSAVSAKQRKENTKKHSSRSRSDVQEVAGRGRRWIITEEERTAFKQLSNDEERDHFIGHSGPAAIPRPIPQRTNIKKSTIAASRMPTNISPRAFPVGKQIAAVSI